MIGTSVFNGKSFLLGSLSFATVLMMGNWAGVIAQNDQNPSRQISFFDRAIEQVGGIRKGQITYASFSNRFDQKLDVAVRDFYRKETYYDAMIAGRSKVTYSYTEVDINNDGRKDAFVQLNNSFGSGSGGVHTSVFIVKNNGYEYIGSFGHQVSLVVLPSTKHGWQNILRVPGKIFSRSNPNFRDIFYEQCSYKPTQQWKYIDCQNIRRGSVVSGTVIETSTFGRNPPEFSLL